MQNKHMIMYIMIYKILIYLDITNYEYSNELLVVVSQQQRYEIYTNKEVGTYWLLVLPQSEFLKP